jgi:MFS family permease
VVGIFFFASVISVIDRGILNLVVDPVRQDLMISEVQISLLQGFSFGLFYAIVGLPLGMSADRLSRRWLLIVGIAVWSFATILGGLAPNFGWMFVSRILVGLGEATLAPCAVSIISDCSAPSGGGGRSASI